MGQVVSIRNLLRDLLRRTKTKRKIRPAAMNRRDFLKYSGAAGGAILFGMHGGLAMANTQSNVSLVNTENRKTGVASSML